MKRFLIQALIIGCISIISIAAIDCYVLLTPTKHSMVSHERNVALSYQRLKQLKNNRKIVVIAGSNGGFSINSRIIQEAFNLPVVNTSTHAGIGIRLQFEMYKDFIQAGDIIVFCPEYGGDIKRLYGSSTVLRILSTHLPSAYLKVSIPQGMFLYKYLGIHFDEIKNNNEGELSPQYSINALNKYGDIECQRLHKDSISTNIVCGKMDNRLVDYIKYIHDYTKSNGIYLVFLPPTFMESSFENNKNQIDSLSSCLTNNGITWQAAPERYSFPDSFYYDSQYHMTQEGANLRTKFVVEDMKRILNYK